MAFWTRTKPNWNVEVSLLFFYLSLLPHDLTKQCDRNMAIINGIETEIECSTWKSFQLNSQRHNENAVLLVYVQRKWFCLAKCMAAGPSECYGFSSRMSCTTRFVPCFKSDIISTLKKKDENICQLMPLTQQNSIRDSGRDGAIACTHTHTLRTIKNLFDARARTHKREKKNLTFVSDILFRFAF